MGMYCACDWKMTGSTVIDMVNKTITEYEPDPNGCTCDWEDWTSIYDWPPEKKNTDKPFSQPSKEGCYLVRIQTQCGDRYEAKSFYSITPRIVRCKYTGKDVTVFWEGDDEEQPYAWRELKSSDEEF